VPNVAVVIGINDYANPEWNLRAAVDDALAFAGWALDRANVDTDHLRLMLSGEPETELPFVAATAQNIFTAIADLGCGFGKGADRLFFYYAGHGASVPGLTEGGDPDPVLIPADVKRLHGQQHLFVRFSQIMPALISVEPRCQFFFIDACRDFALEGYRAGVGGGGHWAPPDQEPEAERETSDQYVLYAVSPGKRAQERRALKKGVFGATLVTGLHGEPGATNYSAGFYNVSFETLARFVEERTAEAIREALPRNWAAFLQVPQKVTRATRDPVLESIPADLMKRVPVTLRVTPSEARRTCELKLFYDTPGGQEVPDGGRKPPPIDLAVKLSVLPFNYRLEVLATDFKLYEDDLPVWRECIRDLELEAATEVPPSEKREYGPGSVTVTCADPSAKIVVYDSGRLERARGSRWVSLYGVEPGVYTATVTSVEGSVSEQHFFVRPGANEPVSLTAPGPVLGKQQADTLRKAGIEADEKGFIRVADGVEPLANARLSTLLAYAALAAQLPRVGAYDGLRELGVNALTGVAPGRAGLLTLLARSDDPSADEAGDLAGASELIVRNREGVEVAQTRHEPLRRMAAAGQAALELDPGCVTAELRIPGLEATRYALSLLPDRVTVLIAVGERSGAVEVEQHIMPLRDDDGAAYSPRQIRALDVATRHYERREPLGDDNFADLLVGKWLDPLLGALAGYALIRAGETDRYIGRPSEGTGLQESALKNMLNFFSGLPDSHVLAALCEPQRRDEHFGRALELGLPVFAEGFRKVYEWHSESPGHRTRPLWVEPSALLPGSIWTAWAAERPAIRVENGSFGDPPPGWGMLEDAREAIERMLPAVGALCVAGDPFPFRGTAFAVGPGLVATATYGSETDPSTRVGDTPGAEIDFGSEPAARGPRFAVTERVAEFRLTDLVAITLLRTTDSADDRTPFPLPLRLASQPPEPLEGRRVAVIGYPGDDMRLPADVRQRVFGEYGVKRILPGRVLSLAEQGSVLRHDCLTAGGNGGSPVIDLESGEVLALHYGGLWFEYKRGDASPLWPFVDDPALASR
jgi:hypothetical protein